MSNNHSCDENKESESDDSSELTALLFMFITLSIATFNLNFFWGCMGVLVDGQSHGCLGVHGGLGVDVTPGVTSFLNRADTAIEATIVSIESNWIKFMCNESDKDSTRVTS